MLPTNIVATYGIRLLERQLGFANWNQYQIFLKGSSVSQISNSTKLSRKAVRFRKFGTSIKLSRKAGRFRKFRTVSNFLGRQVGFASLEQCQLLSEGTSLSQVG